MSDNLPVPSDEEEAGERFKRLLKKSAEDEERLLQELDELAASVRQSQPEEDADDAVSESGELDSDRVEHEANPLDSFPGEDVEAEEDLAAPLKVAAGEEGGENRESADKSLGDDVDERIEEEVIYAEKDEPGEPAGSPALVDEIVEEDTRPVRVRRADS